MTSRKHISDSTIWNQLQLSSSIFAEVMTKNIQSSKWPLYDLIWFYQWELTPVFSKLAQMSSELAPMIYKWANLRPKLLCQSSNLARMSFKLAHVSPKLACMCPKIAYIIQIFTHDSNIDLHQTQAGLKRTHVRPKLAHGWPKTKLGLRVNNHWT